MTHSWTYRLSRQPAAQRRHMAEVTQVSHSHSDRRAYYERTVAEGKTPKRRSGPSNAGSATLSSPSSRQTPAGRGGPALKEPGTAAGERLHRPRGRLTPQTPALRPSNSQTLPPTP